MSATDDEPGGRAALVRALRVRQNIKRGVAAGVAFTLAIFGFFVALAPETVRSPLYYVALAVVLALSTSGLAATILVARRAYHLSQDL